MPTPAELSTASACSAPAYSLGERCPPGRIQIRGTNQSARSLSEKAIGKMKLSRIILVVVVVVVIVIAALVAIGYFFGSSPACTSTWNCGAGYPLQIGGTYAVAGEQCVGNGTQVVCIGGQDANAGPRSESYYSSPVSPSSGNITGWASESYSYPKTIDGQSCVLYSGYVYCVGGELQR